MTVLSCQCMETRIREILDTFPAGKRETLIPLLQVVQETLGYLPEEALEIIGAHLKLSREPIRSLAVGGVKPVPSGQCRRRVWWWKRGNN